MWRLQVLKGYFLLWLQSKNKKRNKLGGDILDDCLITIIERDIFLEVDEDDIIKTFMVLRKRRPDK
jgi:hypothetical protein